MPLFERTEAIFGAWVGVGMVRDMVRYVALGLLAGGLIVSSGVVSGSDIPDVGVAADVATTAGAYVSADTTESRVALPLMRDSGLTSGIIQPTSAPLSQQAPGATFDPATMMRAADIKPGSKGYGLSVMSGIAPEKFEAEVVGVRHRMMAGQDIIMVQLKHPRLVDIGVVAGMSGSPVFIDDKLIGAVAYGFMDVKEALAGVTPIEYMLDVYNSTPVVPAVSAEDAGGEGAGGNTFAAYNRFVEMKSAIKSGQMPELAALAQAPAAVKVYGTDFPAATRELPAEMMMRPLSSPLFVSSSNARTMDMVRSLFRGYDVQSTLVRAAAVSTWSPSASAQNSPGGPVADLGKLSDEIQGGHALAVPFIEGDLNMAGIGTVSYRKGNRLVAFGHPMMQQGTVYFPMSAARINAIVRSSVRPFKLGEPLGQVGMVRQDRLPAIGGLFGQTALMLPVHVVVEDPQYQGRREFNYRLFNNKDMAPGLLATALMESLSAAARSGGDSVAFYDYSFAMDDGTTISREDYIADADGSLMAAFMATMDVGMLMNNPFKLVRPESFSFEVRVADKLPQARIVAATLEQTAAQPGTTVTLEYELQPYRKDRETHRIDVAVPAGLVDGDYTITIADGSAREAAETRRSPGLASIFDYDSLVRNLQRNFPKNKIYVTMEDQDTGVSVLGQEMPKLPSSIISTVRETAHERYFAPVAGNVVVDADVVTDYEISGRTTVELKVRRNPKDG